MPADLTQYARQSTVKLTTIGRKSGRKHTVPIWFVVSGPGCIYVQHVQGANADWYKNLVKNPEVEVDFGGGTQPATATPITDAAHIRRVLGLIRRKYLMAWIIQLFGIGRQPVAAEIGLRAES